MIVLGHAAAYPHDDLAFCESAVMLSNDAGAKLLCGLRGGTVVVFDATTLGSCEFPQAYRPITSEFRILISIKHYSLRGARRSRLALSRCNCSSICDARIRHLLWLVLKSIVSICLMEVLGLLN